MKIKKVNIESFAGIKNKTLDFTDKFNLIYGENEAGKSTIENFIKIWLYGIDTVRGKFNDRKKYSPLNGEIMRGELIIEHENKSYIIKRKFGASKRDDTCEILDEITGEEIKVNNKNEIGKELLGINSSTFMKTLFISQLGVKIDKDKEEEIMEKITNIYNSGDESTSVKKAIERIEKRKKQLVGSRKNGELDSLREKRDSLREEYFEGEKLGTENIDNEENLIRKNELKEEIKEQIQKLDLYKKYIKKVKLQKDYKDISKYLLKGEELKRKQAEIDTELKKGEEYITLDIIEDVNSKSEKYLSILDVKKEQEQKLLNLENEFNVIKDKKTKYSIFDEMGENINSKLLELKMEQKNIEDKLMEVVNIRNSISRSRRELNDKSAEIGNFDFIKDNRSEIEKLVESYKYTLKELKYKIENSPANKCGRVSMRAKSRIIYVYLSGAFSVAVLLFGIFSRNIYITVCCIPIIITLIKMYLKYSEDIKNAEAIRINNEAVQDLKDEIEEYEEELDEYIEKTNSHDYEGFMANLLKYDKLKSYKESINLVIKDKEKQIESFNIESLKETYNKNKEILSTLYNYLNCKSIDEVIDKLNEYIKIKEELSKSKYEMDRVNEEVRNLTEQMEYLKEQIDKKCRSIGIDEKIEVVDLILKLKEYKEKIETMNEVKSELKSVEETYKVLLKDRNIDEIKDEMKDIISQDITYSYESEEEIEKEIRNKSNELLKVEKEIKDLEHLIEKRFIGKREIPDIEEDILINEENISNFEKEYDALDLAGLVLQESFDEMRKNIGPELNNNVVDKFNLLTNKEYKEAKIAEDYKLKLRDSNNLFDAEILSNGAKDQLYLALRLSFIEMLFTDKDIPLLLDDAFIQYDDERRRTALKLLNSENFKQTLFFTCQKIDKTLLDEENLKYNIINI